MDDGITSVHVLGTFICSSSIADHCPDYELLHIPVSLQTPNFGHFL